MLTPYGPGGLLLVRDGDGRCVAVIDPATGRIVRAPGHSLSPAAAVPGARGARGTTDGLNQFSGVFPNQGSYAGGTLVTIIGTHFSHATAVYFGPRPAASFAVLDDRTIVAVTPSGSGSAPVTVTTPGGTARVGSFYYQYWPSLSGVIPAAGPVGGGNIVTLRGANLSTALLVHFGDAVAFPLVVSDAQLLVTAPPVTGPGSVPVYVAGIGGVSNRLLYTYAAAPSVTAVSPAAGPIAGGSTIVVTGTGLAGVTGVTIGGLPATSFRAYSDTLLVVVTPPGTPGPADITVTTPGGSVTVPAAFDYMAPSTTEVTSDPDPALVGQPVAFTATVAAVAPTTGTPTGTVTFDFGDGTAPVTAAVTDGTATVSHAYTAPSGTPYAVTAAYSGDLFFTSSSGADTQVVEASPTTTTLTSTPDPSQAGQPVAFVARVAPAPPGAGVPTGTVTFDFGDGTPPVTLPVSGGTASVTHAYATAAESPYPVSATYDGDDNFTPSTGTDSQTVQQAATATAVSVSPTSSVAGQPVTVTASVTSLPPGAGTPTGTVTFDFGDGTPPVTLPLTDGTADATHAFGAAGSPYTLTATYSGDDSFSASTGTGSQTVGQASSALAVSSTPDSSTVGQEVTFTATVTTLPPGGGTPTGTVTFDFGDGTPPVTLPLTDGTADATHAYTDAAATPYTVTVSYSGDADISAATSTALQTVGQASSATTVTSTPDPSTVGQQVTFTATVATLPPGSGTPTGTVTFDFGDGSPTTTALLSAGSTATTHAYTDAAGSPYTVTATYNGDANVTPSTGTDDQTVQTADTTLSLDSAPDPSTIGQSTTFVAKITPEAPAAGAPTGTVTFDFGDGSPPVTAPVEGGTATVTHTNSGVADSPYTVTATYSGDGNFNPSAGADTQVVTQAVSSTALSAGPSPSVTGQAVTFAAVVSAVPPAAGTPTGTVTFDFGDGTPPVTLPLTDGTADATHAYTDAAATPYTVTVSYSGDTNFLPSSGTDLHSVEPAPTLTTVTAAPDPSVTGEAVTVTVTPRAPGAGIPTGQAAFDFGDGSPVLTAQLENGTATVVHAYTSAAGSPYTITAHYSGDADFAPSDDTLSHTVAPAATTTVVTSSADPAAVGQSVTLIARVRPVPPGAGDPTGTVTFDFGDGTAPVTAPVSGGLATAVHAYAGTAGSPYTVTASYSGDPDFAASSGTAAQRVDSSVSTTATTVSSAPDPSTVGESVTFTAVVVAVPPASGTPTGTVTFDFGDGSAPVTAPLAGGTATAAHTYTAAAHPASVTAVYHGDTNFAGSAGLDTQTVSEAVSSTTLTSSPDPSVTGGPVTFTATVAAVDAGAGTPTGSVTLDFGDGSPTLRAPLTDGIATAVHAYTGTSGSPYAVTATYNGDAAFTGSTDTGTQTVNPATTATAVFSSPDPSTAGQPVTVTASLAAVSPGTGTPTGTVTFDFGDGTPPVTTPAVGGLATVTHAYTTTVNSPFTLTAAYSGDADFAASTGTTTQTVLQSAVTLAVSTGPNPTVAGEPVTLTATAAPVPPGAGVPTDTITVDFGDGTAPVTDSLAGGALHLTHTYASVAGSPYTITATYNGSDDFSSAVVTATETVLQDATTTTVAAAPIPSVVGQPVTFTASVKPVAGGGSPTGTVTLDFGDGTVPVAMPVVDGVATAQHAFTGTFGSPYAVTAAYSGDTDFTASGGGVTQTVGQAPSVTTVTASPDPSVTGQPVTVTATVAAAAPGAGSPTGTVTFDFGDGTATVTAPVAGGVATAAHTWTGTAGSPYTVTAAYSGDTDFSPATGTGTHTVAAAGTTTVVVSSPDPSVSGQVVTVMAGVAANTPGDGVPTGTVTFDFGDGSPAVTASLTGGTASTTHAWPGTSGSPYTVTATYSGDGDFAPSTGSGSQSVTPATTALTVSGLPEPSVTGQPVTFFARVAPDGGGDGTPTGTVTYDFGDGTTPVVAPVTDGMATAVHAYPSAAGSPFTVTATYSGDADFLASVAAEIHTVLPAVSTTVVSSSPDPSVSGQPVTVTAAVTAEAPGAGTPTGTVTFDFGDGTTPVTAPVTDGTATATHVWSSTSGSPYTLTATYSGDAGFTPSKATGTKTVTAAATTTAVTSSPDPSVPGQSVTLTATVAALAPGAGSPTGTVTFTFGDGTPAVSATVLAGSATVTHAWAGTAGSPYPITADYSGDPDFNPSSGSDTQTVGQGATGLSLVSSPDPSVAGQEVTFTARVTAVPPGAGTPTGTVTFDFGDGTAPVTAPVSAGVATIAHTYATASATPYAVTATYSGDPDFAPATVTAPHTVAAGAATTSTTVVSSPDPTVTGQPVTFTATVTPTPPGAGVPTGTVAFDFGDGTATITAPVSGGVATVTHTYVSAAGSPYAVSARYSGDSNFSSSSGTDLHTVAPASTLTTLTSAPDPSVTGQPVTLTATVAALAPGAGVPTGTVTFDFGDGTPTTSAPVSGGVARVTHTYTSASGPLTVTALYDGDVSFLSSSGTDTQTVNKAATTTAVVSSPDPTVVGQAMTITASVASAAPGSGTPTGTVTFDFGDGTAPVTAPVAGGLATVAHTYTATAGSPYPLTATYNGDANYTPSSGTDTQTVNKAATTTAVVSSPDPTVVGQTTTITATVVSVAPGTGTPTGTVTFSFGDGSPSVTAPVVGGQATVTRASTSSGPVTLTATYNGDANYTPSNGSNTQTVNKAATTTALASAPDPTVAGQSVTLTATVAPVAPGAGTPTGTVTFSFGDGTGSTTATLSGGTATVTHTYTATSATPYPLAATYNGDANYTSSSGSDTQTVNKAATTTALVSSPDPSVAGQPVTLTATVAPVAPWSRHPHRHRHLLLRRRHRLHHRHPLRRHRHRHPHLHRHVRHPVPPRRHLQRGRQLHLVQRLGHPDRQQGGHHDGAGLLARSQRRRPAGHPHRDRGPRRPLEQAPPPAPSPSPSATAPAPPPPPSPAAPPPSPTPTPPRPPPRTPSPPPTTGTPTTPRPAARTPRPSTRRPPRRRWSPRPIPASPASRSPSPRPWPPSPPGAGTPTGTVTFSFGDGTGSTTATLSGGTATVTHTYTAASTTASPLTATYNGGTNFTTSSGSDTQTVNKAATATAVSSTPDPSAAGQAVTVTAAVSALAPGAGTPTGTVTFTFGDGTSSSTVPLSGGIATVSHTYTTKTGSPFPLTAKYNGDTSFTTSSGAATHTVNQNLTTTTVTTSPDPSVVGQSVTLRATVSSAGGIPTGKVTFSFGDGTSSVAATLAGGVATVTHTYTTTTGSPFTVTATYGGEVSFTASSGTDTQTVNKAATLTSVVSTPNPASTGDRVTVTATVVPVAPGAGTPSGTVTLAIPGRTPQTVALVNGSASATFSPLPRGIYTVTGNYNGDVSFAGSTGLTLQTVV
uniref:IPT/TIG domain-containing protein n=1 Tax=Streptomyces caniferus TaxID=285557 RepID=A0A481RR36_9ACTN|nr:IPT/TIG domain-containing protein [Streptomyces caniferus]